MATLGGTTVPDPEAAPRGMEESAIDASGLRATPAGVPFAYSVGTRTQFRLSWKGITAAQAATLRTLYQTRSTLVWAPTEGGTYTCLAVPGSWRRRDRPVSGGFVYEVEMALQEVGP